MKREMAMLELRLHGRLVGQLSGFRDGRNALSFSEEFINDPSRPTFSLLTHPLFPNSKKLIQKPWNRNQRLHPVLSNLLPEGSLRDLIAQALKTHTDNEFEIFSYLGGDLPGALVATQVAVVDAERQAVNPENDSLFVQPKGDLNKFSLAGVQLKFSVKEKDGRYNLTHGGELGDWIVKTPSTKYQDVPLNEFTSMTLAKLAGIEIPEIKLLDMSQLVTLPQIDLPDEKQAYAIKRFDRSLNTRVHMEDFAQVFAMYPHEKYDGGSYEQIGRVLANYSGDGVADLVQFAKRLLVNILLANGDAHLKNWSLYYPDQITPRLSPAYDIVFTQAYINNESRFALNLAKTKTWYSITWQHFEDWANRSGISWRIVRPQLNDVLERARSLWPLALNDLPMNETQKKMLRSHWAKLQKEFRVDGEV